VSAQVFKLLQQLRKFDSLTIISISGYKFVGGSLSSIMHTFSTQQCNCCTCSSLQCDKSCVIVQLNAVKPYLVDEMKNHVLLGKIYLLLANYNGASYVELRKVKRFGTCRSIQNTRSERELCPSGLLRSE